MFSHLHTHSEYSLLDGLCKIDDLIDEAKRIGLESIALTDHGSMSGSVKFYKKAIAAGIKPIIGVEAYVAPKGRHSKLPGDNQPYHLVLLAKNITGYHNLLKLVTISHLEGFYYRPRMDREILEKYSDGIIALSGCLAGEIPRALEAGRIEDAREAAIWHKSTFKDYYFEIQRHAELTELDEVNKKLVSLSKELNIPLVATNDLHYVRKEDQEAQDILLCIQTNSILEDTNRMKMDGDSYYLKSESEMRELFKDIPESVDNAWKIASQCNITLEFNRLSLPQIDLPSGKKSFEYLEILCKEGFKKRYSTDNKEALDRLEYELKVVREMEFSDYFLVVWDIAKYARENSILIGVRGSAAASLVLYCLNITEINPLDYSLVFERFLNLERIELPDIDLDIEDTRRDEILQYVMHRFGEDRVAQIITFGTLGPRAAIRDVGRVLGIPYSEVDEIVQTLPTNPNLKTLDSLLENSEDLRRSYERKPNVKKIVDTAKKLEGVSRHASTHAAGVVISREPLSNVVPLQRPTRAVTDNTIPMTQWDMNTVAEVGLLKLDFLGLSNLSILARTRDLIEKTSNQKIDLSKIPLDDNKTFDLLCSGETTGLFQLESSGMRKWIKELKPRTIQEISAMIALYRPGPMEHIPRFIDSKFGRKPISHPHDDLSDLLSETYGVIVYQDQVLKIVQKFAGYSLGQADIFRKAMGKKISSIMTEERSDFIKGAEKNGYQEKDATNVFDLIEPFAGYAFNKAHSVSYAYIAYQTAYFKANYPIEYLTCLLNASLGDQERMGTIADECASLNIAISPPSVSYSEEKFSINLDNNSTSYIRTGLTAVKNVGPKAVEKIIAERKKAGGYSSLEDFTQRADLRPLKKRGLESLIKAGALDDFGNRASLEQASEKILSIAIQMSNQKDSNQSSMFEMMSESENIATPQIDLNNLPVTDEEKGALEKEFIGIYFTHNPFDRLDSLGSDGSIPMAQVMTNVGKEVEVTGMIISSRTFTIRNGQTAMSITLQDRSGSVEATIWPDLLKSATNLLNINQPIRVIGNVRGQGDRLSISCTQIYDPLAPKPFNSSPNIQKDRFKAQKHYSSTQKDQLLKEQPSLSQSQKELKTSSPSIQSEKNKNIRFKLILELQETGNKDSDLRILNQLISVMERFPGADTVLLSIITDGEKITLNLPTRTKYGSDLALEITKIIGKGHLSVQQMLL
jgi:DNA polymerase-3 subunit alpha